MYYFILYNKKIISSQNQTKTEFFKVKQEIILKMRRWRDLWKLSQNAGGTPPSPNNPRSPIGQPPTRHTSPSAPPERQQTRGMASLVGKFTKDSRHAPHITSPDGKTNHYSVVDESLSTEENVSHSLVNLTTKNYAHNVDVDITELALFADIRVDGKDGKQYIASKDEVPQVRREDLKHFVENRKTTVEEDNKVQKFWKGELPPIYRKKKINVKNRYKYCSNNEITPITPENNKTTTHDKINTNNNTPNTKQNEIQNYDK